MFFCHSTFKGNIQSSNQNFHLLLLSNSLHNLKKITCIIDFQVSKVLYAFSALKVRFQSSCKYNEVWGNNWEISGFMPRGSFYGSQISVSTPIFRFMAQFSAQFQELKESAAKHCSLFGSYFQEFAFAI